MAGTGVPGSGRPHLGFWSLPRWGPSSSGQKSTSLVMPSPAQSRGRPWDRLCWEPGACSQQFVKGPVLPNGAQLSSGLVYLSREASSPGEP